MLRCNKYVKLLVCVLILSIIIFLFFCLIHKYGSNSQGMERCLSELEFLKYQLNEVTEYKNHVDKLLLESQKAHRADKEVFSDMIESCVAMKQQSLLCQSQFEDLHTECKVIKKKFDDLLQKSTNKPLNR